VDEVHGATAVLATPGAVEVRLEGWLEEVEEQTAIARRTGVGAIHDEAPFPLERPWEAMPVVAEAAVRPSRLDAAIVGDAWGALAGVGLAWVGLGSSNGELRSLRDRVRAAGGIAPIVHGPGGLGDALVAAPEVQRRLKDAFDPNGVLAPGRGWEVGEG
jgi:FAD/FMN-containing dehydrogenase